MKKAAWLIFFISILTIHLAGITIKSRLVEYASKPLIVFLLLLYFLSQTSKVKSGLKKWILLALLFCWAGDVLLLFQENNSLFFLLGLSAFLVAQIFYIMFFNYLRKKGEIRLHLWLVLIGVIYYALLITFLFPRLGDMKWPVSIYGIVINVMLILAMHMLFIKDKIAGKWMMAGAVLFVLSDSVLAVNKFYQSFEIAGVAIMLTYGLAQLFIVEGAIRYVHFASEK